MKILVIQFERKIIFPCRSVTLKEDMTQKIYLYVFVRALLLKHESKLGLRVSVLFSYHSNVKLLVLTRIGFRILFFRSFRPKS